MARGILAAHPLLRNDIPILAQLFEVSFDYYINHNSPFLADYLQALRTLIGLGFTAVLADRRLLCSYEFYLERFLAQGEGDFKLNQGAKRLIAQSAAEMVCTATLSFNVLRYPRYYDEFIKALYVTIAKIPIISATKSEAARIMGYLSLGSSQLLSG